MAIDLKGPGWIDLDGAVNARDLGGLPLIGGGTTRRGVLVRADNLQGLTARDVDQLVDGLGVRVVVDLRTGVEVELEGPGPLVADGRAEIRHRSLFPELGRRTDAGVEQVFPWKERTLRAVPGESRVVRSYLGYLGDRPDSIVAALRDVAHADGAALVHCAAGKDRTGVVCALALEAAGVAREAVVADFVATGERLGPVLARLRASPTYADDLASRTHDDDHRPRAETMARMLELLDAEHGGAAGWLDAHGFGEADRTALRRRLAG